MGHWYYQLLRYPKAVLLALTAAVIYLALFIPDLRIDASSDSLTLEGDKSLEVFREIYQEYGSSEFLFLAYQPKQGDIYQTQNMAAIAKLSEQLKALEGVSSVVNFLNVPLLYSPKVGLANMQSGIRYLADDDINKSLARKEFKQSPIYRQLLTSLDETTTAIQVNLTQSESLRELRIKRDNLRAKPNKNQDEKAQLKKLETNYKAAKEKRLNEEKALLNNVRQAVAGFENQADIFVGGVPMIVSDMLDFVRQDMKVFGAAILVFIVLSLGIIFRRVRWVLLPLMCCFYTAIFMLGGIGLVGLELTVISANFIALLLIITLSISIHLVVRFVEYEKQNPELSQRLLVQKTTAFMIKPCVYTSLTTMVAFMSLVISDIRPIIDFGWMMTIAVALALVLVFVLLPCALMLLPKLSSEPKTEQGSKITAFCAHFVQHYPRSITVVALLLVAFAVSGVLQLEVENRFIDYFHPDTEIYQGMLVIDQKLGGTLPLEIVLNKPKADEPQTQKAVVEEDEDDGFFSDMLESFVETEPQSYWFSSQGLQQISQVHNYLDNLEETGKVLSLNTFYQVLKDISGGQVDDVQLALVKNNAGEEIQQSLISPYLSSDGEQTRISLRVKETSKGLNRSQMLANIEQFLQDDMGYKPEQFKLSGMMVLYNNMLQSLYRSQILTLAAVFVAIMLMFALLFRSLYLALLAIAPNMLAAALVLAGMGWAGIPLDIMTITIAAITVGIGVDDTIHYIHRFKEELHKEGDYLKAMQNCHSSIGRAMFYTSITIIVGFSILALSNFTPSVYFGLLTATAMFTALMGALILLPHLLLRLKPIKI